MNFLVRKTLLFLNFITLFLSAQIVLARAGGGGGHRGHSSFGFSGSRRRYTNSVLSPEVNNWVAIMILVIIACILIYAAYITFLLYKKSKEAERLMQKLKAEDPLWSYSHIKARIEEVFYTVQQAWTERDQEIAKHCMSERIYQKHKLQTDAMHKTGRINVLEEINLAEAKIISIADFKDNSNDSFQAYLSGTMVDYHISEKTGNLIRGDHKSESFKEIWHFIRQNDAWVLDQIDQDAGYDKIVDLVSRSESVNA